VEALRNLAACEGEEAENPNPLSRGFGKIGSTITDCMISSFSLLTVDGRDSIFPR
jgi:hypothetical protein